MTLVENVELFWMFAGRGIFLVGRQSLTVGRLASYFHAILQALWQALIPGENDAQRGKLSEKRLN